MIIASPQHYSRNALAVILALAALSLVPMHAQTATTLSQVAKIYVEPFSGKRGASQIRDEVLSRLGHDHKLTIVTNVSEADAVLKGTGEIWTKGYIGTNPRAAGSNRSAVYGGYLSLKLEGKDAQPLWSYLVTPAGSLSGAITTDLADRGAKLLMIAVAQGRSSTPANATSSSPEGAKSSAAKRTLKGAGATFPAPLYQDWFQTFREIHPEVDIVYDAVGSEQGIRRLLDGQTDFAASDLPTLPPGAALQRFATVLGGVVPIYNLRNIGRELRFTPEILAGIYLGKITRWDDPAIRAVNHGLNLPNEPIAVFHRSDGSGTTHAFTDFLSRAVPDWKTSIGSGSTVSWPAGTGAEGNDGVATQVAQTPNSIGYVELTYAVQHELSFGSVRNAAGVFISANLETVAAAAQSAIGAPDPAVAIGNAPGSNSYPIASFTWIVLPMPVAADNRAALEQLLRWALTSGQKQCSALGYAPLPKELASRELQAIAQLK
jgi:phosphate ABC transporter phosphate-binding protein